MEFSDLLLWTAGGILLVVGLQSLSSWKTDRGGGLKVVLAIVVCTVLCSFFVPAGYVLGALVLGMVILPSLAHARAVADLDAGRYGLARFWSYLMQMLLPRRDVRQAMVAMRALCAYRSGAATDVELLAQGLDPVQRDQLLLLIACDEHRWSDVSVLLDRLPEVLATSANAWMARLRLAYETGDYQSMVPAYREIETRSTRAQMRLLNLVRRDILVLTGEVPAAQAMETAMRGTNARDAQQLSHAIALWCSGDEAEGRRQVALLAAPGAASHRVQMAAQQRLAHPPVPAAQLPLELRELGAILVTSVPRPQPSTPVTATLIGINSVIFVAGQILTSVAMGQAPSQPWDEVYERVLLNLGALTPTLCTAGHEWWRLLSTAFLHANILHIAMNMFGLAMLGPTVERRLGWVRFLILYLVAGLVGNAVFCLFATLQGVNPTVVGASGCIMGIVGALGAEALIDWRAGRAPPRRFGLIIVQIMFQVAFDMSHPDVAGSAHLGGLFSGFLVALVMMRTPRPPVTAHS